MATPQAAETSQRGQEAIAAASLAPLRQSWQLVDLQNLTDSIPQLRAAVESVVTRYGRASAAAALNHFRVSRIRAGVPGRISVPAVPDVPEGFIDEALAEAVAEAEADMARATAFLDSQAQHLVMEQGRRQMLTAVQVDREARGWARITHEGACSFCLMLALRAGAGFLYTSKRAANFRAHTKQPNGSGGDCRCTVEPVFGPYEPIAQVREAQKLWESSTKGRSGHDARVAFRQAVEGREVTGSKTKPKHKTLTKGEGKTPENQRAQLRVLEAMPPAKSPEAAKWRTGRVAEIRKYLGE